MARLPRQDRRAILGVPMSADRRRLGALNLDRRDPGARCDEEIEVGEPFGQLRTYARRKQRRVHDIAHTNFDPPCTRSSSSPPNV